MKENNKIEGKYSFRIFKDGKCWVAECKANDGHTYWTQGRTKKEIFEMIADMFICLKDL